MDAAMCKLICRARPCLRPKARIKFDSLQNRDVLCNPLTGTVIQSARTPPKNSLHTTGGGGVAGTLQREIKQNLISVYALFFLKEDVRSLSWTEAEASFASRCLVLAAGCRPAHR